MTWTEDLIAEIMDEHGVDRTAVPRRFRFQNVRGKGFCHCDKCKSSWASYWIWLKIDVRRARIDYHFKQKCKKCTNTFRPFVKADSLEEMTLIVIRRYNNLINGVEPLAGRPPPNQGEKPHKSELCEKCGYGERKCWMRFNPEE